MAAYAKPASNMKLAAARPAGCYHCRCVNTLDVDGKNPTLAWHLNYSFITSLLHAAYHVLPVVWQHILNLTSFRAGDDVHDSRNGCAYRIPHRCFSSSYSSAVRRQRFVTVGKLFSPRCSKRTYHLTMVMVLTPPCFAVYTIIGGGYLFVVY